MRFWAQKVAYWRTVDRAKIPYERKYSGRIGTLLTHAVNVIVSRVQSGQSLPEAADRRDITNLVSLPLSEVYTDLYFDVGKDFGRAALRALLSGKSGQALFDTKAVDEWDVWDPLQSQEMRDWTRDVTAQRIRGISNSTAQEIRDLADKFHIEGWDTARLVVRLRDAYGFSKERAQRIAQTEVNSAQNAASHFAIGKHVDTEAVRKEWLAVGDRRMRKSHERANGQERAYEAPFKVGGAQLMFPGDTSLGAPGQEIIRCRCVATYAVGRGEGSRSPVRHTVGARTRPDQSVTRRPSGLTGSSLEALTTRADKRIPDVPLRVQATSERKALASALKDSLQNAPEVLKRAVENGVNELGVVKYTKMNAHYDGYIGIAADQGKIKYSNPLDQALRHEYGHHFDFAAKSLPTETPLAGHHWLLSKRPRAEGGLGDAIAEARKKLVLMRETNTVAWNKVVAQMRPKSGDSTASMAMKDIFGTLSYGRAGGGHDRKYYIMNNHADSEVFANLFELTASGQGGKQLATVGEYFPSLLDDFVAALRKAAIP